MTPPNTNNMQYRVKYYCYAAKVSHNGRPQAAFRMWRDGELRQPKPGERKRQRDMRRRRWFDQRARMRDQNVQK